MKFKSFKIEFPYDNIDWINAIEGDFYDVKFIVEFETLACSAKGYFGIFDIVQSSEILNKNLGEETYLGFGAWGAMSLRINRYTEEQLLIKIQPQKFGFRYDFDKIDLLEDFLKEYSNLPNNYPWEIWKNIMQQHIDQYNNNKAIFNDIKYKDDVSIGNHLTVEIYRSPMVFRINNIDFLSSIIDFQQNVLKIKSIEESEYRVTFEKILKSNLELMDELISQ